MTSLRRDLLRLNELHSLIDKPGESPVATVQRVHPYLHPRKIPRNPSLESSRHAIEVALRCLDLICRLCKMHLRANRHLANSLVGAWPRVWKWLEFLHTSCCEDNAFGEVYRVRALVIIPTILGDLALHQEPRKSMTLTPGLLTMLTKMWLAEDMEGFEGTSMDSLLTHALNEILHPHERTENSLEDVFSAATGGAGTVARVALEHLEAAAARKNPDYDTLFVHISLVCTLSDVRFLPSHRLFLCNHMIPVMVKQLSCLVNQHTRSEAFPRCVMFCCGNLLDTLMSTSGPSWVCQMLDAGVLPVLLKAGGIMADLEPNFAERGSMIITTGLFMFLTYRSVLRSVAKTLKRIDRLQIGEDVAGPLWNSFLYFKMAALHNLDVKKEFDQERTIYSCGRSGCGHNDNSDDMRCCAGCLIQYYCDRQCQKIDWPSHRVSCKSTQQAMRDGFAASISKNDHDYRISLLLHDFEKQAEVISDIVQNKYPAISPSFLVALFDYRSCPVRLDVYTISSFPFTEKWSSVIKRAEESEGQLMIVMGGFEAGYSSANLILSTADVPEVLKRGRLSILGDGMCEIPSHQ